MKRYLKANAVFKDSSINEFSFSQTGIPEKHSPVAMMEFTFKLMSFGFQNTLLGLAIIGHADFEN